jgi:uncharacterized cupredoxin-like copper-binding protein
MRHKRALSALIVATALTAAACGSGEDANSATESKSIEVTMTDNEFTPSSFEVEAGQEVTFRFTNDGSVDHEAIVGNEAEQAAHEADMSGDDGGGMDGMDHGGSDSDAITVGPGDTGELTKTFDEAGTVILGCHVPGHYDSGMKATITVT